MPDAYTKISKPTGTPYTNTNVQGKEQYDQASLTYDDANTFYDGYDPNSYTMVAKPQIQYVQLGQGFANGLLIPLTRSSIISSTEVSPYTNVPKPTT